jgi:hypothetical protein
MKPACRALAAICACASLLASGKARAACLEGRGHTIK